MANRFRSFLILRLRYPWVVSSGFSRIPFDISFISPNKNISLGNRVQFGRGCVVHCDARFGDDVLIAPRVAFIARDDHNFDVLGSSIWDSGRGDKFTVEVEDDVWIGFGSIVLSGVKIGSGSIVGAGSVVVSDVPRYSIVAGVPARFIKRRFSESQLDAHLELINIFREGDRDGI